MAQKTFKVYATLDNVLKNGQVTYENSQNEGEVFRNLLDTFLGCHDPWIEMTIQQTKTRIQNAMKIIQKDLVEVATNWHHTDLIAQGKMGRLKNAMSPRGGKSGGKTPRTPGNRY